MNSHVAQHERRKDRGSYRGSSHESSFVQRIPDVTNQRNWIFRFSSEYLV